jgi:hypothetical protein
MSDVNTRLKTLARSSCAAFTGSDGCRYQPNGQSRCQWFRDDPQVTPFLNDGGLRCGYMEKHVLPADKALQTAYWSTDKIRGNSCKACGLPYVKRSNRQRFCENCAADRKRQRARDGMKKNRSETGQSVNS